VATLRFHHAARATHAVYGSIIVLAVVTGLDEASASARECLVAVFGVAIAVALSEIYADVIGSTIRESRAPTRSEWRTISANVAFGFGAALVPAIFFVLASVGWLSVAHALTVAEWTGVGVIWVYVYTAARGTGMSLVRSILWSLALTACGIGLVELKSLAGH
jgi:hypothetical protein